jgi:hypothetical protein
MKKLLALTSDSLLLAALGGCTPSNPQSSQFDADLGTIRSGHNECVKNVGADAAQCKTLADGTPLAHRPDRQCAEHGQPHQGRGRRAPLEGLLI